MHFDAALCQAILEMPDSHVEMARNALVWFKQDAAAGRFCTAALKAFARRDPRSAANICSGAKAYAFETVKEVAEGVVPAIFALALPGAIEHLRSDGLTEEMIADTLKDYGIWARGYEQETGRAGFGEIGWESRFLTGHIYKIGRLQYEFCHTYHAPYTIYRDHGTGELIPVPQAGLQIDAQGFLAQGAPAAFTTVCERRDGLLRFNAVDTRRARILPQVNTRPLDRLEVLLCKGMQVLNLHIPECGPLTPELVSESLRQAKAFFAARGVDNRVAVCESWLLDPALQIYGAGCGNITGFQNRFALYPECLTVSDAVNRVFGRGTDASNPENLPENTRLRRGLKAYIAKNGALRDAGGVLELTDK